MAVVFRAVKGTLREPPAPKKRVFSAAAIAALDDLLAFVTRNLGPQRREIAPVPPDPKAVPPAPDMVAAAQARKPESAEERADRLTGLHRAGLSKISPAPRTDVTVASGGAPEPPDIVKAAQARLKRS